LPTWSGSEVAGDSALRPLVERVREAAAAGTPLAIRGGGTKDFLGERHVGAPLDVRALAGVVDYEPGELVVTVRAGTPLSELEALLAAHGQMLPFEPPHFGGPATVGGAVAAGLAGPRRASVGGVRDFVLGATLVSGRAEVLRFGGRVMKNVAGFDVSRLLCGSLGVLGPIVELSLKVLPRPALERTLEFGLDAPAAVAAFNRAARRPLPLSATAWFEGRARLRLSGAVAAVEAACAALGGEALDDGAAARWWHDVRHHALPFLAPRRPLWRIVVPPTTAPLPLAGALLVEWAGALRWLRSDEDPLRIRAAARAAGGSASLWHGPPGARMFDDLPPAALAIQRRLKAGFDPAGIFNRGRLVAGL
jgi:glycolate oxidase FAD binding subunit